MTRQSVVEYGEAVRVRYRQAGRKEKQRILDEFCENTGMHRKSAIRLLNREGTAAVSRGGRPSGGSRSPGEGLGGGRPDVQQAVGGGHARPC